MGTDLEALFASAQPMAAIFLNSFGVRRPFVFHLPLLKLAPSVETANIGTVGYRGYCSVGLDLRRSSRQTDTCVDT